MKHFVIAVSFLLVLAVSAEVTDPGSYSYDGQKPGVLAPPGYYVPVSGATALVAALPGHYVNLAGATSALPANVGAYVAISAATAATLASPGYYVATAAASTQTPARIGFFVDMPGATNENIAVPGTYINQAAATAATLAAPGYYVATAGASAQTPARIGFFVDMPGATNENIAVPGTYINQAAATAATLAAPGYYVATAGASAQTPARIGAFVDMPGATNENIATPGTYIDSSAATAARLAAPGYYVATAGASAQTPAQIGAFVDMSAATNENIATPGTYIYRSAATAATRAAPGYYVATAGASAQTPAQIGYYVATEGGTSPFFATPGFYVPFAGATAALRCPAGTTSYVASAACRLTQSSHPGGQYVVSPYLWTDSGTTLVLTNLTGAVTNRITLRNVSTDVGHADPLTDLTILGASFSGRNPSAFSAVFVPPVLLHEGTPYDLEISVVAPTTQSVQAVLSLPTDQYASLGVTGRVYQINVVCLQSEGDLDSDADGLLDTEEALLGTDQNDPDSDRDGVNDGVEAASESMDPLQSNSELVGFVESHRADFDLYTPEDIQEGSMGRLVLEPLAGGRYQVEWILESTTNLVAGGWEPVVTNQIQFTPEGADPSKLFRIKAGR